VAGRPGLQDLRVRILWHRACGGALL